MANTYSQIHLQFVFAVKHRTSSIHNIWKDELYKYITGIITHQKHKLLAINGMPDHIHILVGMKPHQSISDLMQHVKRDSSKWINERKLVKGKFEWQEGFGVFSYSKSHIQNVALYIENQEMHHSKTTFNKEYISLLQKSEIEFDEKYLFQGLI